MRYRLGVLGRSVAQRNPEPFVRALGRHLAETAPQERIHVEGERLLRMRQPSLWHRQSLELPKADTSEGLHSYPRERRCRPHTSNRGGTGHQVRPGQQPYETISTLLCNRAWLLALSHRTPLN